MKTYKILTVKNPEDAESAMNEMARQGWAVKAVTHWETISGHRLMVTFEKDA